MNTMNGRCCWTPFVAVAALLLVASAGSTAVADADGDLGQELDSLFVHVPYAGFVWVNGEDSSERVAIRVPVMLDGVGALFQLDTGLDVTMVYGNMASERGWDEYGGLVHVPSFKIGTIDLGAVWINTRDSGSGSGLVKGSIGLDLLVGSVVLIDYPRQRFAIMRHGDVPVWMWQRSLWGSAELRDAKLFVGVTLDGKPVDGIFFDTGSSGFDMVLDFDAWRELTGCPGPDSASVRKQVPSWGNTITALGAPARGRLTIGATRVEDPLLFTIEEKPRMFDDWPFPATGLVGNAPFWDGVVIVDLGIRPRFGVLR